MLQDFITSALIIDDDKDEVEKLIEYLESKDIWVKHFMPSELDERTIPFNNRKIIFLDLYLDDKKNIQDNVAKIRSYFTKFLGNGYGTYGIVLWTKHSDEATDFIERIYKTANKYTPPLFVIALGKDEFLRQNSFNGILEKLEEELLNDVASSFFIEWNKAVKKGSDSTITTLYNLFDSNDKKNKHLESVLYKLACNYTGIPENNIKNYDLQKDLVKSLMNTLQFEISNKYKNISSLFEKPENLIYNEIETEKLKVFAKLNSLLLIDSHNLNQGSVIPGNIYEVIDVTNPVFVKDIYKKEVEINLDNHKDFEGKINKYIAIELTPPCDFAGSKNQFYSRIIGGIILNYDKALKEKYFNTERFYSFLYPINIDGYVEPQMIIFDFYRFQTITEDNLKNDLKFKLIIKAKDNLFADILQKLSSHTARLGIANMR